MAASVTSMLVLLCGLPTIVASCLECGFQDDLFEWVRKLGGYVSPKLKLSAGLDDRWTIRGLFATEDIEHDELLFSVPHEALICSGPGEKGDCRLVSRLREEMDKEKASAFQPYLAILKFQHPIVWSYLEKDLIADFTLNFKEFNETYQDWCGFDLSDEHIVEAAALAWTRQFWLGSHCMIPVLDLLNHDSSLKNVEWSDSDMLHAKSTLSVEKGSQLFNKYEGPTPDLFRTFGFLEAPPHQWFFDGSNGRRQFFSIDASENVKLKARGESSLAQFSRLIREHLMNLEARTSAFKQAAAVYKGSPDILASVWTYRNAYLHALRLALEASGRQEL